MKILFILENYYPNIGGVETLFKNLAESLANQNFQVTVLTTKFSDDLDSNEIINGVNVVRVSFKSRYLFTLLGCFAAVKYANKHNIIHTTSYNAGIPAFIAGLLTRKKTIITFHEVWGKLWFRLPFMNKISLTFHYLFEWILLRLPFHKFIAVSKFTGSKIILEGISESKVQVIYNGIDYDEYNPRTIFPSNEYYQFAYFGRLGISKGLDLLLKATQLLSKTELKFRLKLVIPTQPSGFHKRIRNLISKYQIESYIDIRSDLSKSQLKEALEQTDAVVIPSYSEGFCFSAVESMAMKIPIISSGQGALSEVVNGKHLHIKSMDAESLKNAMMLAMDDKWNIKDEIKFPLEKSVRQYIKMYADLK